MEKKSIFAGLMAFFLLGAGSATVLSSFGTISGTADVRPALNITDVGNVSNEEEYVNLTSQTSVSVDISHLSIADEGGSYDVLNNSENSVVESGEKVVVTDNSVSTSEVESWFGTSVLHLTTDDSAIGAGLNQNVDTVYLKIDDTVVDSFSYGDSS